MAKDQNQTYDFICFTELAYEFTSNDRKKVEQKIKRRLKYYNKGDYDQNRINYIRHLKEELYSEINATHQSKYFTKQSSVFAELNDFNTERMKRDFAGKYPDITLPELAEMINFAIFLYYLR